MSKQKQDLAVVHWKIGEAASHGKPIPAAHAQAAAAAGNAKYGAGTHWIVMRDASEVPA